MAIDNTPPRMKLIVTIAAITVVTLISIDFVAKGYYAYMVDTAAREKVAPTKDLENSHKAEQAALAQAAVPVDQAMKQLAAGQRPESISPKQSEDLGPMTGWSKAPKPAPTPAVHVDHPPTLDTAGDGGAARGDAGAAGHDTHAGDAGAPKKPPAAPKDGGH